MHKIKNSLFRIWNTLLVVLFVKDTWKDLAPCDILLLRHDVDCGYTYEKKKYSILIDSIKYFYEKNGYSCQTIAKKYSKKVSEEAHGYPLAINRVCLLFAILRKLKLGNYSVTFWKNIFLRSKAQIIIAIQPDQYMCEAAHSIGTSIYDFQHGAIESSIRLYLSSIDKSNLPTAFLLWNASDKNVLENSQLDRPKTYIVGHPFIYRFRYPNKHDNLVMQVTLDWKYLFLKTKPNILITLQPLKSCSSEYEDKILPEYLIEMVKETMFEYNYFFRAHPIDTKLQLEYIENIFYENKDKINYKDATKIPLPLLLSKMNLHLTKHSAVVLECVMFEIHTILWNQSILPDREYENLFLHERQSGYASIASPTKDELLCLVKSKLFQKENTHYSDLDNVEKNLLDILEVDLTQHTRTLSLKK